MMLDSLEEVLLQAGKSNCKVSFCIWGGRGIGKTQMIKSVAKKLGWGHRNLRLSQIDPTELIGFPTRKKETIPGENGQPDRHIEYLDYDPPRWFVDAMKGKYIIFLDELNRAKNDVVNAAFELVQERELNGQPLPDNVLIIVAVNPSNDKYHTSDVFSDEALADRFCHIHAQSNYDVWKKWAKRKENGGKANVRQSIVSFLDSTHSNGNFNSQDEEDLKRPFKVKPSPRSWEKVDQVLDLNLKEDLKAELVEGLIGDEIASNFMASLREGTKPITMQELFEMSEETVEKLKMMSDNLDEGSSVAQGERVSEISLINVTCENLVNTDDEEFVEKVKQHSDQVFTFLSIIPPDLAQKTLKKLCNQMSNKEFWQKKINEPKLDPVTKKVQYLDGVLDEKGNPQVVYRWQNIIDNLESLAKSRDKVHERMNQSAMKPAPNKQSQ